MIVDIHTLPDTSGRLQEPCVEAGALSADGKEAVQQLSKNQQKKLAKKER